MKHELRQSDSFKGVDSERSQKDEQESIMIILASGKRIVMATASSQAQPPNFIPLFFFVPHHRSLLIQENVKWLLAIDGMKDKSMLTTTEKVHIRTFSYFCFVFFGELTGDNSSDQFSWLC